MIGFVAAAFGYGFRHGFDWDHVAAITDICAGRRPRLRAVKLATLYALGHAAVVVALGSLAIVSGDFLPDSLDSAMGRVVGATLVLLGASVLWGLVRHGRDFRLRSRWMLVFSGIYRGVHHVRRLGRKRMLALDHAHEHEHVGSDPHDHPHPAPHPAPQAAAVPASVAASVAAPVNGPERRAVDSTAVALAPDIRARHSHPHRHTQIVKDDPFASYGPFAATGVGMLHGVGVETPTQVLAFVLAAEVSGTGASIALLMAWVVGLFLANTLLTVTAVTGFVDPARSFAVYVVIAIVVAAFSLALGTAYLFGLELPLPS